jgi:hypothetical protein
MAGKRHTRTPWTVQDAQRLAYGVQLTIDAYAAAYDDAYHVALLALVDGKRSTMPDVRELALCAGVGAVRTLTPGWSTLRALVYERDRGTCRVCGRAVPWRQYQLGHLRDRMTANSLMRRALDVPQNVVLMCSWCNYSAKPVHHTRTEALCWIDGIREVG